MPNSKTPSTPLPPRRDEIEDQLARILASASFSSSPKLSSFLTFIVAKALAGQADHIKGYTIGVEIYGKPADYNPEADSTVRVEAIRLRKTLAHYYQHEGRGEPVLITVGKGSYRPHFSYNFVTEAPPPPIPLGKLAPAAAPPAPPQPEASAPTPAVLHTAYSRSYVVTILAITLFMVAMGFILLDKAPTPQLSDVETERVIPVLTVFPFYVDNRARDSELMRTINEQIISKLNLFHNVRVVNSNLIQQADFWNIRSIDYARSLNADYVIEGSIHRDNGNLRVEVKLLDSDVKNYVWTREEKVKWAENQAATFIDELTTQIVSQIASPYGALENVHRLKLERNSSALAANARCVLAYQAYSSRKSPEDHLKVRDCLEATVRLDPDYSDAWAALAWIYGDEVRMNYNLQGTTEDANNRALQAGRKAVDADARNPRAHQYMALAAQAVGQNDLVRQHTDMALTLNPYDSEVVADAAWVYCQIGEWERCRELGEKAMRINPLHPDWYNFALFIYHFNQRNYPRALDYAIRYQQPDFLWSNLLVIASYAKLGLSDEAEKVATHIRTRFPEFAKDPMAAFKPWGLQESVVSEIMDAIKLTSLKLDLAK